MAWLQATVRLSLSCMLDPELRKARVCQPLSPMAKERGLGYFPQREGYEPLCGRVSCMSREMWTANPSVKTLS